MIGGDGEREGGRENEGRKGMKGGDRGMLSV